MNMRSIVKSHSPLRWSESSTPFFDVIDGGPLEAIQAALPIAEALKESVQLRFSDGIHIKVFPSAECAALAMYDHLKYGKPKLGELTADE